MTESPEVPNVLVVCLYPEGKFGLESIPFHVDIVSLEPDMNLFDCYVCQKRSSGICSQSFHVRENENISYVSYCGDPHTKDDICSLPTNIYANLLLSCGMKECINDYRGNIYFIKHNLMKQKERKHIEHGFTPREIIDNSNVTDCDKTDVDYIEGYITHLPKISSSWCILI